MRRLAALLLCSLAFAGDTQPLPSPEALLQRMMAAAKAAQASHEALLYRSVEIQRKVDKTGQALSSQRCEREVVTVNGQKISRLLSEDDKALEGERAQKEEARVQAALRKALGETEVTPKPSGKEIQISAADLMAVLEFHNLRREHQDDRDCLLLDFRPRKDAKPQGLGQRFAAKLEGRIRVDEASAQVLRAEGHMTESFWLGAGLLGSIAPPTTFELEQAQVLEGIWMPTRAKLRFTARAVVVPIRMEFEMRFEGFSRFETGKPELTRVEPKA